MQPVSRVLVLSGFAAGALLLCFPVHAQSFQAEEVSRVAFGVAGSGGVLVQPARAPKASAGAPAESRLLCAPDGAASPKGGLGLFEGPGGLVLQPVAPGTECKLLATGANLNIQFPGQGPILLGGPVNYRLNQTPRRAEISVIEPLLCESYYAANDRLALRITDSNGAVSDYRGALGLSYAPSLGRLSPSLLQAPDGRGAYLQCYSFPFAQLIANPPAPPAPVSQTGLFRSGFESAADLRVEILDASGELLISTLDAVRDSAFTYQIRVRNIGEGNAANVRVREFVPTGTTYATRISAGAWSCQTSTGANCTPASGATGALADSGFDLAAGAFRTYTLTRTVTTGTPPNSTLLAAAAFFDPIAAGGGGDAVTSNNSAPLIVTLVPNQLPQFTCSYPDRNLPAEPASWVWSNDLPVNISVDEVVGGAPAPIEFECRVRDPDGESFDLAAAPVNSNPTLVPNADLVTQLGPAHFDVRIAPAAAQIGTAQIVQTATDERGGAGRVRVNFEVRDVNSPPSFELLTTEVRFSPTGGLPRDASGAPIDTPHVVRGANCPSSDVCTLTFPDFLTDRSVGLPPESPGQQLSATIACAPHSVGINPFEVAPAIGPASAQSPSQPFSLSVTYRKSNFDPAPNPAVEVDCLVTVTDTGSPPLSADRVLRFIYNP